MAKECKCTKSNQEEGMGKHCCGGECHCHDEETIVSEEPEKLTVDKFAVDSAVFIVYTSHNGDKSMTTVRSVSYPKFDDLLTDLGLINQWFVDSYADTHKMSMGSIPYRIKQDPTDVAVLTIKNDTEETKLVISICVIPNSQDLEKDQERKSNPLTAGILGMTDLYSYDSELFYRAFHFIISDFENRLGKQDHHDEGPEDYGESVMAKDEDYDDAEFDDLIGAFNRTLQRRRVKHMTGQVRKNE